MKKIFLLATLIFSSAALLKAQDNCMAFFPDKKGVVLVNKNYNAENDLLSTMTYTVLGSNTTAYGEMIDVGFELKNAEGAVIDQGRIDARCENGTFYMRMSNRVLIPEVMDVLTMNTELVGDFMDYPNAFDNDVLLNEIVGDSRTMETEYTVQDKTTKKEYARVRVYNRDFKKDETVQTPAGTFTAAKISYDMEVYEDGGSKRYKGVEWYAPGAGIVRSEIYDRNNVLQSFTLLTAIENL